MDKRTIAFDACDLAGGFATASNVISDIAGTPIDITNLDALFDVITEYGNGLRIIVKNAEHLTADARRMFDDALANSDGLEVVLECAGPSGVSAEKMAGAGMRRDVRMKVKVPPEDKKRKGRIDAISDVPRYPLGLKILASALGLLFVWLLITWAIWSMRTVVIPRVHGRSPGPSSVEQ